MIFHKGNRFTIDVTDAAEAAWVEAEAQVPGNQEACKAQLRRLLTRLGDFGELQSPNQMNDEGDGIFAVKARCGLRAYGWYSSSKRRYFVIGHVVLKTKQKLDKRDHDRACEARRNYEGN